MGEVKGPLRKVRVVLHDRWSGPETLETKVFTTEDEANKYAKQKDERGKHYKAPESYVSATVEKVTI